ncbi:STAS domain-containing protein [Streptomyces roseolilacinus]|uniref:STAS domain-containing protein n=1 Tax=Streptomyces roseolilacinus TaxID=66904 RepID=UPI003801A06F
MSDTLEMTLTETRGPLAVASLTGVLDFSTAPVLYERGVRTAVNHSRLILSLAGVTFCDSSGLNALLRLHLHLDDHHGRLVLAAPPVQLQRSLAVTGMTGVFHLHPSTAEALTACTAPTGP